MSRLCLRLYSPPWCLGDLVVRQNQPLPRHTASRRKERLDTRAPAYLLIITDNQTRLRAVAVRVAVAPGVAGPVGVPDVVRVAVGAGEVRVAVAPGVTWRVGVPDAVAVAVGAGEVRVAEGVPGATAPVTPCQNPAPSR